MGVKFSELHILPTNNVASDDYLAILDVSDGLLKRTQAGHASVTDTFGKGDATHYGHVVLSDTYVTERGSASDGLAASQKAVYDAYTQGLRLCLTAWVGTYNDWVNLPNDEKNKYTIVNITDQ